MSAAEKPCACTDPETCTAETCTDRGNIYLGQNFLSGCEAVGVSVQPTRPHPPAGKTADKSTVERTLASLNTLLSEYLQGPR